ncbi:MAG: acetylxylan esterase [Bacteroidaceae bacterium]|nr:acetylxylan esterase [Bacteroidaceae bacterium]
MKDSKSIIKLIMKLWVVVSLICLPIKAQEANYDESKVGTYTLPDALTTLNGQEVINKKQWEKVRRPEILKLFQDNEYGIIPNAKIKTSYRVLEEGEDALDGKAIRRQVEITFNGNGLTRKMLVLLYIPKGVKKCPVFVSPNFQGNATTTTDPAVIESQFSVFERAHQTSRWSYDRIISSGYAVATFHYYDVYFDQDDKINDTIYPLFGINSNSDLQDNTGKSIAAWAWGCSRVLDYLLTLKYIDKKRAIVLGHSRLGKAALWCGAQDQRFAMVISNDSGCSGAALSRRNYGETVAKINHDFPWWFCNKYQSYSQDVSSLPMDQHELLALIAPRLVYVASAQDDQWADPRGEFLSLQEASKVYALYGLETLQGSSFPSVNEPLWKGNCGYHMRTGIHDVTDYDWQSYIEFANKHLIP